MLRLYVGSGTFIQRNDGINGGHEGQIGFTPTVSGTYYLGAGSPDFGSNTGTYTVSASIVTGGEPTGQVTVSGTPQRGQALTANTSQLHDPDGLGTFTYQWQTSTDNGQTWTNIVGNQSVYFAVAADVGNLIRVNVSYKDGLNIPESVTGTPTAKITDAPSSGFQCCRLLRY